MVGACGNNRLQTVGSTGLDIRDKRHQHRQVLLGITLHIMVSVLQRVYHRECVTESLSQRVSYRECITESVLQRVCCITESVLQRVCYRECVTESVLHSNSAKLANLFDLDIFREVFNCCSEVTTYLKHSCAIKSTTICQVHSSKVSNPRLKLDSCIENLKLHLLHNSRANRARYMITL